MKAWSLTVSKACAIVELSRRAWYREDPAERQLAADQPIIDALNAVVEQHAHCKLTATTLNRLIPQDDSLAKNVAASRKKSRSFFTRASSSSSGTPEPAKALSGLASSSRFQRLRPFGLMPSSRATQLQDTPGCWVCKTASRLNSALYFLRVVMNTPSGCSMHLFSCVR